MVSVREIIDSLDNDPATTLRTIKNSLTGQELRKVEYIQAGLIPALAEALVEEEKEAENDEDATKADVASITAIIANSGPAFTYPLLQSDLIELLLDQLRRTPKASRLELTTLRCLNTIADNLPLQPGKDWTPDQTLARLLYADENASRLVAATSAAPMGMQGKKIMEAALSLVCKTCSTERQRTVLVQCGLIDTLADQLAVIVILTSHNGRSIAIPDTQQSPLLKCLILETACILVEASRENAESLAHNTKLAESLAVLESGTSTLKIPHVPDMLSAHAARRSNFPPLGSISAIIKKRTSSMRHDSNAMVIEDSDDESSDELAIVPWLIHLARSSRGRQRVLAARLLGILKCHGLMHPIRARSLAALLIPLVVETIETKKISRPDSASGSDLAPSSLALLVRDNEHLQDAAVEAKAIPRIAAALKANFEVMQELEAGLWWPQKLDQKLTEGESECCLGPGGPSKQMRQNMHTREGLLQALAALAPTKDAHRKEICEHGALAQITLALEPFYSSILEGAQCDTISVQGNSSRTLIAACNAVRALTRSATALRTKLVDAEVAKSVLRLLQSDEPEVRIAVTMVIANLAHDFSPMKPSIGEYNVVHKLCQQAHSAHARLRKESLYALKALVNNSTHTLKRQVVDELGPGWIGQLAGTDPYDIPPGEVIGLTPREYRKGSMVRVSSSEDAHMEDAPMEVDPQQQDYTRHTLQEDLDIQTQMLAFLRNLTAGERPDEIIKYLLDHIGQDDFMHILLDRLQSLTPRRISRKLSSRSSSAAAATVPPETVEHAVYVLAHMCAADQKYRQVICYNITVMKQVSSLLNSSHAKIRTGVCWLMINLVYETATECSDSNKRRGEELQKLGIVAQLRRMQNDDSSPDVVERVKTALDCIDKLLRR